MAMAPGDDTERDADGTLVDSPAPVRAGAGVTIANRYQLERRLGAGGMGVVYRARDTASGEVVALKLVRAGLGGTKIRERFERETAALAAVVHPGVVRYHDHGTTPDGGTYLAMELVEGEDLAQRLARGRLSLEHTLALARQVAEALAAAHGAGVIHRDLKPSNILLPAGELADAKLLDFGVARLSGAKALTRTGHVVGTPGYMSPEQARGEADVDGRTDIYSLGCVVFECLTGEPPFPGEHAMAVLAKILLEDTPRLAARLAASDQTPVPPALDELVYEMMARDRDRRPVTPAELLDGLALIDADAPLRVAPAPAEAAKTLSHRERRVLSVLFVGGPTGTSPTATSESRPVAEAAGLACREVAGELIELVDGSVLVSFPSADTPTDQAQQAARCALALHRRAPLAPIVLASGHGVVTRQSLLGEVIDRGAKIMHLAKPGEIRLDEPSAALVEPTCLVDYDDDGARLQGLRAADEPLRTLLGRPTPFVGRARELAALEGVVFESVTERCANAIVVIAEPGVGKSRLRHELLRRVSARWPELDVLIGRADLVGADAAFALLARALRGAAGIRTGDAPDQQAARFADYLFMGSSLAASSRTRVATFLGELVGIASEHEVPALVSARADPQLMREAVAGAWEEWLSERCQSRGVLLVLEDLHWGDASTVDLVGRALAALDEQPLVVLALARPEIDERFVSLWADSEPHRIELAPLSRRAARKLATRVLGDADAGMIDAAVDRAAGNAFYLEELLRVSARGRGDQLPETVLGMVQSRLAALDGDSRRLLRAGAVFGEIFWTAGVARLVGEPESNIGAALARLSADEFLTHRRESTMPGLGEYVFRHALVRDAAYATLTHEDRRVAHGLAGQWLEATQAAEPAVLARHFMLGGRPTAARRWYEKAAVVAFDAEDHQQAIKLAEAGLECGGDDELRGRLRLVLARVAEEVGDHADAIELALVALEDLRAGSRPWYATLAVLLESLGRTSHFAEIEPWMERALATTPDPDALDACVRACAFGAIHVCRAGQLALADGYAVQIRALASSGALSLVARRQLLQLETELADMAGDLGRMLALLDVQGGVVDAIDSNDLRARHAGHIGHVYSQVGANDLSRASFEQDRDYSSRRGLRHRLYAAVGMLAILAFRQGDNAEAEKLLAEVRELGTSDPRFEGVMAALASVLALSRGALSEALDEARASERCLSLARPLHPYGLATLANAMRAQGQLDEALGSARRGMAIIAEFGTVSEVEVDTQVAYLEALLALGQRTQAREELRGFKVRFDQRSRAIADPQLRVCFCTGVPANVRLLELCSELGVSPQQQRA